MKQSRSKPKIQEKQKSLSNVQAKSHKKEQSFSKKQSFLNKFKDKHSIVSKAGLLNLLDNKKKLIVEDQPKNKLTRPISLNHSQVFTDKSPQKMLQNRKMSQIIQERVLRKYTQVSIANSVPSKQIPKQLPVLIKKSVSHTQSLHKSPLVIQHKPQTQQILKNSDSLSPPILVKPFTNEKKILNLNNGQLFVGVPPLPNSNFKGKIKNLNEYQQNNDFNVNHLDRFALDHLDFLQKFQERIRTKQKGK